MITKLKAFVKKYPFIIIGLSLLVVFTIILVISALNIKETADIDILVAPASATVKIDGKYYENGTFRIPLGEHTVSITKEGFIPQEFTFNTLNTSRVYAFLEQEDGSYSWYLDHESDALLLTQIGTFLANEEAANFSNSYSVISKLPIIYANYDEDYNYTEFRIDGGSFSGCNTNFCLKVTDATGGNLEKAKKLLEDSGVNLEKYQILYEYTPIIPLE